ncbi:hypothetical protein B1222_22570 [Paenibacillus larvae subsp. pulvifaciens]|nr:hypothetical protein B1222_22570 [Paenibacillus larvae subsp. pulvifaciens]
MAYFLGSNAAEVITFAIFNRMAGVGEMESVGLVLEGGGMRGFIQQEYLSFLLRTIFIPLMLSEYLREPVMLHLILPGKWAATGK